MTTNDSSRVSILKDPPLPADVAAAVLGRAQWLRTDLETIDAELGLQFPPIEVVPVCWLHQFPDGTVRQPPARVTRSLERLTVQITAPSLLEYPDDLVRGILVEKFLRVARITLALARSVDEMTVEPTLDGAIITIGPVAIDGNDRADARRWLSPRLDRLAGLVDDATIDAWSPRIVSNWIDRGFPSRDLPPHHLQGWLTVDPAIWTRGDRLAENRRRQ